MITDVITEVIGTRATLQQAKAIDPLILTSEQRLSPHGVMQTAAGRNIRISLPRSSELMDGDLLAWDGDVAIVVEAAPEALLIITPTDKRLWGIVGFQLGNLHRPVRFSETAILSPADPMVAEMLKRAGVAFEQKMLPFVGERYATQAHAH